MNFLGFEGGRDVALFFISKKNLKKFCRFINNVYICLNQNNLSYGHLQITTRQN